MSEQVEQATAAPGEKRTVSPLHEEWMTPEELAEELRVPVGTLYQWRYNGTGPTSYKIGRHVRYKRADLNAWLAGQASNA